MKTEKEIDDFCREELKKAIEEKDGVKAHFYGRMLYPTFIVNPPHYKCGIQIII